MTEDFKEQLKEYLSEELQLVITSFRSGSNGEIVRVDVLLEGEAITSDSFTIYQNYKDYY